MPRITNTLCSPHDGDGGFADIHLPAKGERTYRGERVSNGDCQVWLEEGKQRQAGEPEPERRALPFHREVRDHSSTGFNWGYGGSGPAQLALALLVDALGDAELAQDHYQSFKRAFVAKWGESWRITAREILEFVATDTPTTRERSTVRFPSGQIVSTSNALRRIPPDEIMNALGRHLTGDWGELDAEDWRANEDALRNGDRLLSAYRASNQEKFWIITEADRSVTTVLLPEDY